MWISVCVYKYFSLFIIIFLIATRTQWSSCPCSYSTTNNNNIDNNNNNRMTGWMCLKCSHVLEVFFVLFLFHSLFITVVRFWLYLSMTFFLLIRLSHDQNIMSVKIALGFFNFIFSQNKYDSVRKMSHLIYHISE